MIHTLYLTPLHLTHFLMHGAIIGYGNNFYAYGTGIDGGSYETGLFWRADDILGTDPFDGDSGGNTSGGEGPSLDDFTHIGNGGNGSSQIGIDDNPYGYDDYTSQVEFYVEYDRSGGASLTVDPTTLYYDPGTSTYGSSGGQEMGVYFDAELGLASALVPSENTYTQVVHELCTRHPVVEEAALHLMPVKTEH